MGGAIGMGNTCKPMAVSFQCMTKFTTKKKMMSLILGTICNIFFLMERGYFYEFLAKTK